MPSCDLPVFTLIVFDMVILFNMETFEKHPIYCIANKCMGHMFGGGGGGCVTQNFYHLTQTMDSEVFPLLWDIIRTICNV